MRRSGVRLAALALLLVVAVAGCGGDSQPEPTAWPDGLKASLDQSRLEFKGREVFVRLINDTGRRVTVTRAVVTSPRFDDAEWTGEIGFEYETGLEFELSRGDCGGSLDAEVTLTYTLDDGPPRVSTTKAEDRYGSLGLLLDRDCAEQTLREAADLHLGEARVAGSGRDSVFELPVTFTPTGDRNDVDFRGFESTVLFGQAPGSAWVGDDVRIRLTGDPVTVLLRMVPTRCDPHALAEDKVGTLIPVRVDAPELTPGASFHLPIGDERRGVLRGIFAPVCIEE